MQGIAGKTAIVTGGAGGLGAGLARAFVRAGVRVVIADIQDAAGHGLARSLGSDCVYQHTDLCRDGDIDELVQTSVKHFGGIDFLLNVACSYAESGGQSSRTDWHTVFDINLFGHAMLLQNALDHLKRSPSASVVNFSSASGHIAQARRWVYPATKAAIEQFTRSAAIDLAPEGIRVNALLPGWIAKDAASSSEETRNRQAEMVKKLNMLSRLQTMDEVADAALFLCSEHARFITGSCLVADGGYTALGPQGLEAHVPNRDRSA